MDNVFSISWQAVPPSGVIKIPAWVTDEEPIITTGRTMIINGKTLTFWKPSNTPKTTAVWVRNLK